MTDTLEGSQLALDTSSLSPSHAAEVIARRDRYESAVRALIERGLRSVVSGRRPAAAFILRKAAFRGDGLVAGRSLRDWETIRDLSYSERGA